MWFAVTHLIRLDDLYAPGELGSPILDVEAPLSQNSGEGQLQPARHLLAVPHAWPRAPLVLSVDEAYVVDTRAQSHFLTCAQCPNCYKCI